MIIDKSETSLNASDVNITIRKVKKKKKKAKSVKNEVELPVEVHQPVEEPKKIKPVEVVQEVQPEIEIVIEAPKPEPLSADQMRSLFGERIEEADLYYQTGDVYAV